MLDARPASCDRQRHTHANEATRRSDKSVACRSSCGTEREEGTTAPPSRQAASGKLKTRHGAHIDRAKSRHRRDAQSESGLPHRQHHVDEIGAPVMQRMGDAGHE
jgi:hypothetical protein